MYTIYLFMYEALPPHYSLAFYVFGDLFELMELYLCLNVVSMMVRSWPVKCME